MLERHYSEAIKILRSGLREYPEQGALQLELGRAYMAMGEDRKAQQLFRDILRREPDNRSARLELARALAYQGRYEASDALYRQLLTDNAGDEAAAIGLTGNLMHRGLPTEATAVTNAALRYHPNSLRLLEYRDRIASGLLHGDERALPVGRNSFSTATDYINDSAGNHAWRETERLELRLHPQLTSDLNFQQQFLHSVEDPLESVQTFSETLRWRPSEKLGMNAGGGAVRFDAGEISAVYEISLTSQLASRLLVGAGFSRIPVTPDAEAAENRITAQGWEAFGLWWPGKWQATMRASRRHYTDSNVAEQEFAELVRQWSTPKVNFTAGYRFRHYGFSQELLHGYFSPDNYLSHQATVGAVFHPNRRYRAEFTGRVGAESIVNGADYQAAWEISVRNQVILGHWELGLDYSRYHMAQFTGAFRADAARCEFAYHF